jgi:predicted DNA-binding transcriptional regulator YafY
MYNQHKILRVFQLINLLKSKPAKSIRQIAKTLEVDTRTVYRYLDLIKAIGFYVEKDDFNRYFIDAEEKEDDFNFTSEEAGLIKELLLTLGQNSPFKDSILKKLFVKSDIQIQSRQILKVHLSELVQQIVEAIKNQKQIILKKYYSANSQNIEDRLVEPIHFTDNYMHLVAFEILSQKIKHYHIERITELEISNQSMQHASKHQESKPDVFGFGSSGQTYPVDLWLSLRAFVFLKEEYPLTIPYLKYDKKQDKYRLKVTVNNKSPIERFVKGLEGEVY